MERQRKEMEAQIERQRKETEARLSSAVAISAEQIIELQARVEKLHASKLLTDDELFAVEVRSTYSARIPPNQLIAAFLLLYTVPPEIRAGLYIVDRICVPT